MGEYKSAEAFALMKYKDKVTGKIELIWNSRDGVTPFIVMSLAGNESSHVNWRTDWVNPNHVPEVWDRIFVDLTEEEALRVARKRVERRCEREGILASEEEIAEVAEEMAASMMEPKGQPDVQVVTEEIRQRFLEERKDGPQA